MSIEMSHKLAQAITKERLYQWRKRNAESNTMTTPIVLVNIIHGDKSGVVLNITQDANLSDVLKLLQIATQQVHNEIVNREMKDRAKLLNG